MYYPFYRNRNHAICSTEQSSKDIRDVGSGVNNTDSGVFCNLHTGHRSTGKVSRLPWNLRAKSLPLHSVWTGNLNRMKGLQFRKITILISGHSQNLTENICMNRGCCFREEYGCYHFYPSKHQYMTVLNHEVSNHIYTLVPMVQTVPFGNTPMADLRFSVSATSNHSVQVNLWNPSSSSASAVLLSSIEEIHLRIH